MEENPKYKTLTLEIDPYQGAAALATMIRPPAGYVLSKMERNGPEAVITYRREDVEPGEIDVVREVEDPEEVEE